MPEGTQRKLAAIVSAPDHVLEASSYLPEHYELGALAALVVQEAA